MQQWYKPDIVQRFYLYHALNTGLQLEELSKERFDLKSIKTLKVTKDYRELEPVITLIWMVDDTLKFAENYVSYIMMPELVLDFLGNDQLWQSPEIKQLLNERERVLKVASNDTKHLDFLPKNRLIFAFQKNIVTNTHAEKYDRWFRFAEKTRNADNTEEDFREFQEDEIFAEIMRRLSRDRLTEEDLRYIEQERDAWEQVTRLERGYYEDGFIDGEKKRESEIVVRIYKKGKSAEEIAELTGLSMEKVEHIIARYEKHRKISLDEEGENV